MASQSILTWNDSFYPMREGQGYHSDRMTHSRLPLLVFAALACQLGIGQTPVQTTIAEPAAYDLDGLFKTADTVALVKVVSGDTDSYDVAIYKADVLRTFKGASAERTIYFGPYLGTRLGWDYIVFLRTEPKLISPKGRSTGGYGSIRYSEDFDQGYTSMETSYECVFNADANKACDYGVRVCTDYVKLPAAIPASSKDSDPPFGCRWQKGLVHLISRRPQGHVSVR